MANILDPVRNFAIVTLSSGYNDVDTSVVLVGGDGAKLPAPSTEGAFNMVWWNATDYANPSDDPNKEIVRVTARSTDTLTITRAQESTVGTTKNTAGKTYKMILGFTKKMRDDIEGMVDTDVNLTANSDLKIPSQKAVKAYVASNGFNGANFNAPQGFLLNGKIVPSVASGNLTVAIKTLAGANPSASDPVYVRIGDTVRSITAALSVTAVTNGNWCNAGSTELAAKEVDYFVYLGYNETDGVVIGFSRIPFANQYSDFSATDTNEKYCKISTITNAVSTDYYEVIGRFAATIASGPGAWSVPTFTAKNLIQRPIYETRLLEYVPVWNGSVSNPAIGNGSITARYQLVKYNVDVKIHLNNGSTTTYGSGSWGFSTPFTMDSSSGRAHILGSGLAYNGTTYPCTIINQFDYGENYRNITATTNKDTLNSGRLGALNPFTWAFGSYMYLSAQFKI